MLAVTRFARCTIKMVLRVLLVMIFGISFAVLAGRGTVSARKTSSGAVGRITIDEVPFWELHSSTLNSYTVVTRQSSLQEMQRQMPFHLLLLKSPLYHLAGVEKVSFGKYSGIRIMYESKEGVLWIEESQPDIPLVLHISKDRLIKRVTVGEHQGVIYDPGGPPGSGAERWILTWMDGKKVIEMYGGMRTEDLLRAANSLYEPAR